MPLDNQKLVILEYKSNVFYMVEMLDFHGMDVLVSAKLVIC